MVEVVQGQKCPSEEETREAIFKFRTNLSLLNEEYMKLVMQHKVTADFYIGTSMTYAYLPDTAKFKKTVVTRY